MRKTKEILRQKWALQRAHRAIATSVGVSAGAVGGAIERARAAGLTSWAQVEPLDEPTLEAMLYGASTREALRPDPDCSWIHRERSRPGVTLELLHDEYRQKHPDGFGYTTFCDRYREWLGRRGLVMRQVHIAGDAMFVDYSGKRPSFFDPATGEVIAVELFVAVLGASNYTYAEATRSQRGPDWIASHVRALAFFGGAPRAIVCDQLKSGVTRSCRYEPEVQRTYEDLASHYGTTVLPARARKPRDKAKVEVAVQIVQRWILACIRDETFSSLVRLNERIRELLDLLNARVMRRYGKSRAELFESMERPALGALPSSRFEYAEWKRARVNIDYHVVFDEHFYSVPYALVHEEVWVRATTMSIEVMHAGARVASHLRSRQRGRHTTVHEHMPSSHRAHAEWSPSRILGWAAKTGPATRDLCDAILTERPHPEQGFRSCLGILRLGKLFGEDRLEAACARANRARALLPARRVDPEEGSRPRADRRRHGEREADRARERAWPDRVPELKEKRC
ncbi:MAG TPA: IS21 family transposase [Kofleriaceae bacterium]|jgi:transposase|nr:IS21 family transposase [Kofleriaceae bacterium]